MIHATSFLHNALEMAEAVVSYVQGYLRRLGPIEVLGEELRVAGLVLNGDTAIVDMIKESFGFGCTIFLGNRRIATTATARGSAERALGTTTNDKITQMVYRRGERFKGITRTLDKEWVIVYAPLRDDTGRIVGMIACYRELEHFLDDLAALDGSPEAIMLLEATGRLLDANSTSCDMLGLSRAALMQQNIMDLSDGLSPRDLITAQTETILYPIIYEAFWKRADGHAFPVTISLCWTEASHQPCLLAIVRDFTEEYAARDRLRALNRKLAQANASLEEKVAVRTETLLNTLTQRDAMLHYLSDGLLAVDREGVVEVVNPAMMGLMGWASLQPVGLPLSILNAGLAELVTECIVTKLAFTDTMFLPDDVIGEATVSPILIEDDSQHDNSRCMGCVVLMRDTTHAEEMRRGGPKIG